MIPRQWKLPRRLATSITRRMRKYTTSKNLPIPAILLIVGAVGAITTSCGTPSANSALEARLLSASNLPAGWTAAPSTTTVAIKGAACLAKLPSQPKGLAYASATFVDGTAIPTFSETLTRGHGAVSTWQRLQRGLKSCRSADLVIDGKAYRSTVHSLALPHIGTRSSAYTWAFHVAGLPIVSDLIVFNQGPYRGEISYSGLGPPLPQTVMAFADAAIKKVKSDKGHVPNTVSITSAPMRIAHTRRGNIAYKSIGSGQPLLLIMGYGGAMETWDPRFIDTLAQHYRVIVFDNAGIGHTSALRAPVSIDAMANQTSALINALKLKHTNVLGWSMGSMIAQALAVLHPSQVQKLILCAAYPGNGKAVKPKQAAINDLNSGNSQKVNSILFPPNQHVAQSTYDASLSSYQAIPPISAATVSAQAKAITKWWAGKDSGGHGIAKITTPTLIADGTADRLDPIRNTHILARLITGSKVQLYPDAGHAFLFQDEGSFIPMVEVFLGTH